MPDFETGFYLRGPREAVGAERITLLRADEGLLRKYLGFKVAVALDKKGLKNASQWKGKEIELTVIAYLGMHLEKECRRLLDQGFCVRVALPARLELLKTLDVGTLSTLDLLFDLMAFDFVKPKSGEKTNFHAPLFSWEGASIVQTLDFLHDHKIAKDRISLGITEGGIVFKNVLPGLFRAGYGQPCLGDQLDSPEISGEAIGVYLDTHPQGQVFYTSISGYLQSFIYNVEIGDWISFDDAKTRQSKTVWARHQGLRGIFIY